MEYYFCGKHALSNDENAWADDFKGQVFFAPGTSNSRGVLIAYLGSKSFVVKKKEMMALVVF